MKGKRLSLPEVRAITEALSPWAGVSFDAGWRKKIEALCADWEDFLHEEIAGIAGALDLAASLNAGQKTVVHIEALEDVLRLPLCGPCKKLIGGDHVVPPKRIALDTVDAELLACVLHELKQRKDGDSAAASGDRPEHVPFTKLCSSEREYLIGIARDLLSFLRAPVLNTKIGG